MTWPSPEMHVEWRQWASALIQRLSLKREPERLVPFKQADLPAPFRSKYMLVYCTDLATPQPVFSDGTNWRRVTDGTTV